jgi:hypothetical protein
VLCSFGWCGDGLPVWSWSANIHKQRGRSASRQRWRQSSIHVPVLEIDSGQIRLRVKTDPEFGDPADGCGKELLRNNCSPNCPRCGKGCDERQPHGGGTGPVAAGAPSARQNHKRVLKRNTHLRIPVDRYATMAIRNMDDLNRVRHSDEKRLETRERSIAQQQVRRRMLHLKASQ